MRRHSSHQSQQLEFLEKQRTYFLVLTQEMHGNALMENMGFSHAN